MQAQIDEVGRQVLEQRPAAGCVGDDERDTVATQQRDELRVGEAGVAYLDGMAQGTLLRFFEPVPLVERLSCSWASASAASVSLGSREKKVSKRSAL